MSAPLTAEWFEARKGRITGSRVGKLFNGRRQLLAEMLEEANGVTRNLDHVPAIKWGRDHEEQAIIDFEVVSGQAAFPCDFIPIEEWGGATPDAITSDKGILEVKCPYSLRNGGDFKPLSDYPHYWHQMQAEMVAAQTEHGWFFQWAPHGHHIERVERDPAWLDEARGLAREFLQELAQALTEGAKLPTQAEFEVVDLLEQKAEIENRLKELREQLGAGFDGALVSVTEVERKGSIDYRKALESAAPDFDPEPFRKQGTTSLTMRSKA